MGETCLHLVQNLYNQISAVFSVFNIFSEEDLLLKHCEKNQISTNFINIGIPFITIKKNWRHIRVVTSLCYSCVGRDQRERPTDRPSKRKGCLTCEQKGMV